jgi:hypothetical protein
MPAYGRFMIFSMASVVAALIVILLPYLILLGFNEQLAEYVGISLSILCAVTSFVLGFYTLYRTTVYSTGLTSLEAISFGFYFVGVLSVGVFSSLVLDADVALFTAIPIAVALLILYLNKRVDLQVDQDRFGG